MTQHNSSFTTLETYTDFSPVEPTKHHDWIAPLPWWHVTTSSWGLPWHLHVYGLAACYAVLPLASAGTYLRFRPRTKRLGVVLPLLTFLSLVGTLRLTFCLTRPYDFKDTLLGALSRLLLHLAYPFLCGAYALTQVVLVKLTGLPIGSRRFRSSFAVLLAVAAYIGCSVAAHGVVLFQRHLHVILMMDNLLFVSWLLYLCVKFTCSGFLLTQLALDAQVARKCFLATRDRRRNREHPVSASGGGCLEFLYDGIVRRHHAQSSRHCNNSSNNNSNNKRETRPSYGLCPAAEHSQSWLSTGPQDVCDMSFECSSLETQFCFQDCALSNETLTDESTHSTQRYGCPKGTRTICHPAECYTSERSFCGNSGTNGSFLLNEAPLTNSVNKRKEENDDRNQAIKTQYDLKDNTLIQKKPVQKFRRQLGTRRKMQNSDSSEPNESENNSESSHMHHASDVLNEQLHSPKKVILCACALSDKSRCVTVSGSDFCNKAEAFCPNSSGCDVKGMKEFFASNVFVEPPQEFEENLCKRTDPQGMKSPRKNSPLPDAKNTQTAKQMRNKEKTTCADASYLNESRDKSVSKEKEIGIVKKLISQDLAGTDHSIVRKSKGFWKISKDKRMTSIKVFAQDSLRNHPPLWKCHGSNNENQKSVRVTVKDSNRRRHIHDREILLRVWRIFARRWREHNSDRQSPPVQHLAFGGKLCRKFAPDVESATSDEEDENDSSSCAGEAGYLADNEHTQSPLISLRGETRQASSVEASRTHKPRRQIDFFGRISAKKATFQEKPGKKKNSETCGKNTFQPLSASWLVSHPSCLSHSETSFTLVPSLDSTVKTRFQKGYSTLMANSRPNSSSVQPAEGFSKEGEMVDSDLLDPQEPQVADSNGHICGESLDSLELCWTVQPRTLPLRPNEESLTRLAKASDACQRPPVCVDLFRIRQAGMLRRSVQGMYLLTFVNLFACLLNLYSIFGRYGALWSWSTTSPPEPWSWLTFQTLLRLTEVAMSYLTLAIVFIILRHHKRRWK